MKKIIIAAAIFLLWAMPVKAFYLSSSTGNKTSAVEENIEIRVAKATSTDSMAMIKLHFNNVTVLSWTDNSSLMSSPTCAGGVKFLTNDICVDVSNTASLPFVDNILLGTVRVKWGSLGSATIVKVTGNGYYNGSITTEQLGNAGSYTITAGGIPLTALELPIDNELMLSVVGLSIAFIGIGLKIYLQDAKRQAKY